MKPRKAAYGNKNFSGANIEKIRKEHNMSQSTLVAKMQLLGVDINPSSLSKLEGQTRMASDIELRAIAKIFGVTIDSLINDFD